jgi:GT2 family glycosyltransferase
VAGLGSEAEIAVVIPTRNREARLAFALEALAAQTLDRDRFEVVVVRAPDASGPFAAAPEGLRARFLTCPPPGGPAAQRNVGWRSTGAPIVAFTDDDCRPAPDWLERLQAAADGEEEFLQGRTEPDPDERHLLYGLARSMEVRGPSEWHPTCNIAYPRALLEALGGFDERFPTAWGEDSDLGLRALAGGARRAYVDRALVWHGVIARSLPKALREAAQRDSLPLVIARHPGQRRALYLHLFVRRSHAELLLAAAGAPLLRQRRALAASLAAPYLLRHLTYHAAHNRVTPRSLLRLALHLPPRIALDAVELAATLRAALRYRVLVL